MHMSNDELYQALLARDAAFDGRAFVGVTSTGVFCRLSCPARKPKPENCRFFFSVADCIEAGFRACKRCSPMQPAALSDPVIADLLAELNKDPARRWSERDVQALGYDASTVRRAFQRHYGVTFLELSRLLRIRDGFATLAHKGPVLAAQHDSGFASGSGFRQAFARLLGITPGSLKQNALLRADWLSTPLGDMIAVASASHLHLLEFIDRKALPGELRRLRQAVAGDIGIGRFVIHDQAETELRAYFAGRCALFSTPLHQQGSPFQQQVWSALQQIPVGSTCSYGAIARQIGRPEAARAVARANGANQIALMVPCHRVVGADGALTGYGGGLWRKQKLLAIEQQHQCQIPSSPHTGAQP